MADPKQPLRTGLWMSITVRNREGLHSDMTPYLLAFERECAGAGLDVLIHCTRRTFQEQSILYRQGRSIKRIQAKARELSELGRPDLAEILIGVGPQTGLRIRTNSGPGQSLHNYGMAFDGVPIWNGRIIYDDPGTDRVPDAVESRLWKLYGVCALAAGLEWAGNWIGPMREMPHCELANVRWQDMIRSQVTV